jgi:hypothetical protein
MSKNQLLNNRFLKALTGLLVSLVLFSWLAVIMVIVGPPAVATCCFLKRKWIWHYMKGPGDE